METSSHSEVGGVALKACDRCRLNKKKCDRLFPGCTTCKKKLLKCSYDENRTQLEIRALRSQLEHLSNRNRISFYQVSPNHSSLEPIVAYPIPSRWYMPFLINHYHEMQFPSFTRKWNLGCDEMSRKEWIQATLSDPCIFHGILFAASSHLDVLRGEIDNPVTEYHRRHAVKLLLDHISSSERVSVTAVATATYLWHYETMNSNTMEGKIHKQGLQQMVKGNGGLGAIRLCGDRLSNLIMLIDIGDSILNASNPVFCVDEQSQHYDAPVSLVSAVLCQSERALRESGITEPLISLLRRVHNATLDFEYEPLAHPIEEGIVIHEPEAGSKFSTAVALAAMIHLNSFQHRSRFCVDNNQDSVENLRLCLSSIPQGSKCDIESELYVFLCFTGAAAARKNRAWFLAKAGPVVMSLNHTQLHHFKMAITRFCRILQKLEGAQGSDGEDGL
ncbi:unnamed protein product [Clonostachys rosea f. rosea IK726]|uniref:Zn(2)-C6 fungal-type domain-containing protein n=2 Tax=Bionectria ochroleuca TaxID=29856 RepID=A0A0B7K2E7_BIOOC|nr:unnamed protein product [Clonostachys rosea f. rosea IK726]